MILAVVVVQIEQHILLHKPVKNPKIETVVAPVDNLGGEDVYKRQAVFLTRTSTFSAPFVPSSRTANGAVSSAAATVWTRTGTAS